MWRTKIKGHFPSSLQDEIRNPPRIPATTWLANFRRPYRAIGATRGHVTTNIVRHIPRDVFGGTPHIPLEMFWSDDVPPDRRCIL